MEKISIVLKWNNTCCSTPCPHCGEWFKPSWGFFPFIEGTWTPVCLECTKEIDQLQFTLWNQSVELSLAIFYGDQVLDEVDEVPQTHNLDDHF